MLDLFAPGVFLVGVLEAVQGGLRCYELIVALAVFLDDAPAGAFGTGSVLTAKETESVASGPAFDVHIVAAGLAFFPLACIF